jgi:hypothetical protein
MHISSATVDMPQKTGVSITGTRGKNSQRWHGFVRFLNKDILKTPRPNLLIFCIIAHLGAWNRPAE